MNTNQPNSSHEEPLKFEIELSGTYWDKLPQFSVWLDDDVIVQSEISQNPQIVNFERSVDIGYHTLKIRLENKTPQDTVIEDGKIVKDLLLNINDIKIEDISLGNLLWTADYKLDQKQTFNGQEIDHLDNCVNLGWNGTYMLTFTSPFYLWLLENI